MSTHPYRAYHFIVRPDAVAQGAALAAVAAGRDLTASELDGLHPGAAHHLAAPGSSWPTSRSRASARLCGLPRTPRARRG